MEQFEYLPAEEYAKLRGVHHETVKRKCRNGQICSEKRKNKWHVMLTKDVVAQLRKDYHDLCIGCNQSV